MKAIASAVLLLGLVLGLADAHASAAALLGDWNVTAMEVSGKKNPMPDGMSMTINFTASGVVNLTTRISGREKVLPGTYVVKGDEIHITMDSKTDRLKYTLAGNQLSLSKIGTSEVLYLSRTPARP